MPTPPLPAKERIFLVTLSGRNERVALFGPLEGTTGLGSRPYSQL